MNHGHKISAKLYGNGFALKVYLPALIRLGIKRILIDKDQSLDLYKANILDKFKEYIIDINKNDFKEEIFDYTILAVSPKKQYDLLLKNNFFKNTNTLILEKPIATSPSKAFEIHKKLEDMKIKYLINYSFRYASWYENLSEIIKTLPQDVELTFIWEFMARHFVNNRNTWKRFHSEGGAAIRFYGIHLIAILSDIGYFKVLKSNNSSKPSSDLSSFSCSFESTHNLPKCNILINSNSLVNNFSCFYIKRNKKISLLKTKEPLPKKNQFALEDPRIDLTKRFIQEQNFNYNNFNVIKLWEEIEDKIEDNYS